MGRTRVEDEPNREGEAMTRLIDNPQRLLLALVDYAMQALKDAPHLFFHEQQQEAMKGHLCERMAQAAQVIVAEVAEVREEGGDDAMADFTRARVYEAERDEARAQLAALHEEVESLCNTLLSGDTGCIEESIHYALEMKKGILTDTAAAAEAHDRRTEEGEVEVSAPKETIEVSMLKRPESGTITFGELRLQRSWDLLLPEFPDEAWVYEKDAERVREVFEKGYCIELTWALKPEKPLEFVTFDFVQDATSSGGNER